MDDIENYTLGDLESLFFNIKCLIEYYENTDQKNNKYILYLSNGERLQYAFPKNQVAHLIGINTSYLQSTSIFKGKNSLELIKEMCDNAYRIYKLHNDKIISYSKLFSKHLINKMMNFAENIKLNVFDTEFICKYNSSASYMISEKTQKFDYVIIKKYADNKIGLLGLIKSDKYYVPMSNQTFDNYETANEVLKDIITNQELTLLSAINYSNNNKGYNRDFFLSLDNKINKIKKITKLKNEFNCIIDVSKEFIHLANKNEENIILINKIINCIESGSIINIDEELDNKNELNNIILAFNNYVYGNENNKQNNNNYSILINELNKLKSEVKKLKDENSELINTNETLKQENERIQTEKEMLQDTQNKVYELVKPRN